jgi:hypothetical protein
MDSFEQDFHARAQPAPAKARSAASSRKPITYARFMVHLSCVYECWIPARGGASLTCGELADRWAQPEKLPLEEANAFADDIEQARASLPSLRPSWDYSPPC